MNSMIIWISICRWVNRCLLNSTDSNSSFNSCNLDISLITPRSSPWISNNVILLSWGWISSITNSSDSMVKLCSASSRVQDTWGILLENSGVSFNSYRDWLFCNCSHQLGSRFRWNSCVSKSFNLSTVLAWFARLSLGSVCVILFKILSVESSISESTWLPSSVTSSTGCNAINKLLFSKRKECSSFNEVFTFNGSCGWKSPTWSTLTLIFNCVNSSFSSPVNWIGEVWIIKISWLLFLERWWHFESI